VLLRKALFAGSFYDSSPTRLKQDFGYWFNTAQISETTDRVTGVICPHAGYIYSGFCAAHSYKLLSNKQFKTAIILHPSHRGNHFSFSVSPYKEYQTPLGNLELDNKLAGKLFEKGAEVIDAWYHQNEHSMEVQLPFIKYIKPDIKIVPVMFGAQNISVSKALAEILADVIDDETVIVVSTDLSHYHSAKEAELMDKELIEDIMAVDPEVLFTHIREGKTEACGFAGVMTLIFLAKLIGNSSFSVLHYTHSGIASGDYEQVVGYLSASLTEG
jgi:AmmeMemoRadiSam system protein B